MTIKRAEDLIAKYSENLISDKCCNDRKGMYKERQKILSFQKNFALTAPLINSLRKFSIGSLNTLEFEHIAQGVKNVYVTEEK